MLPRRGKAPAPPGGCMPTMTITDAGGTVFAINCEDFTVNVLSKVYPDLFSDEARQRSQDSICRGIHVAAAATSAPVLPPGLRALAARNEMRQIAESLKTTTVQLEVVEWNMEAFDELFPTMTITVPAPTWRPSRRILSMALALPGSGSV